jgi:DNA-directed RNA polymerase subunit RPC12/RpoP
MSSFSLVTKIPVFAVGIGNYNQPQPYRCGRCGKWILYCDEVIKLCSKNEEPEEDDYIDCSKCSQFKDFETAKKKCQYMVYYGEAYHKTGRYANTMKTLRYHYDCVKDEPEVKKILTESESSMLIAPVPLVYGLDGLKEEPH